MITGDVLAVLAGSLAGGFVSGVSGFAFGMVAMICWVWRIDPLLVAPMVVFGSMVTQAAAFTAVRRKVDWLRLWPMLVGGLAGVPVGVLLLGIIDVGLFKTTVGVILILFSSFLLLASPHLAVRAGGRFADGAAGFVGGAMGGLAGLNGPAPVFWCTLRGWDKDAQRSVVQTFFFSTQVLTLAGYALSGKLTGTTWMHFAIMLPAVILAARLGAKTCERINEALFRRIVLLLLLISGTVLLASALLGH